MTHSKIMEKNEHVLSMHNSLNPHKTFSDLAYLGISFNLNYSSHLGIVLVCSMFSIVEHICLVA